MTSWTRQNVNEIGRDRRTQGVSRAPMTSREVTERASKLRGYPDSPVHAPGDLSCSARGVSHTRRGLPRSCRARGSAGAGARYRSNPGKGDGHPSRSPRSRDRATAWLRVEAPSFRSRLRSTCTSSRTSMTGEVIEENACLAMPPEGLPLHDLPKPLIRSSAATGQQG